MLIKQQQQQQQQLLLLGFNCYCYCCNRRLKSKSLTFCTFRVMRRAAASCANERRDKQTDGQTLLLPTFSECDKDTHTHKETHTHLCSPQHPLEALIKSVNMAKRQIDNKNSRSLSLPLPLSTPPSLWPCLLLSVANRDNKRS